MADHSVGGETVTCGSVLLGCLARSFKSILERDFDDELQKETREREKRLKVSKKKKKDKDKKEQPPKKQTEKKTVVREGENSLVTFPNPSSFSVFARIRHFVLQQELCNMYNIRNTSEESEESDESDGEGEDEQSKKKQLPEVVNLGICGVFSILQEVWHTNPELCQRVLAEFLNILQGQAPGGLKNEPTDTTFALFELLMKIVSSSDGSPMAESLSAIASSCLISLVIALGQTSKMLSAIAALLIAPSHLSENSLKVPEILRSLQVSVQAVLVGSTYETDWFDHGVPTKSLVDQWKLTPPTLLPNASVPPAAIAVDSRYIYIHGTFGLMKLGSGYGNTAKGRVYKTLGDFHTDEPGRLLYASGKLYYSPYGQDSLTVIDPESLTVETTLELEVEAMGPQCLFSDGTDLKQIMAKKEGGFFLRKLTTICSPVPVVEEKPLQLSQKSVLCLGRAKYDPQPSLHTLYQDNVQEADRVMAARSFAVVSTSQGKVFYQGSGVALGITGKDVPKGQWVEVELPDSKAKIEHFSCDNTGCFSLMVSDKGTVYFAGINKKGESGENPPGGRQQPKPVKLKRVNKLKEHEIASCCCGPHVSAMIAKDGKMFMFGAVEDDLVDKSTGVVTSLLGVPVSQVSLGRSHTVVLTQLGTIFTFGSNQYGQCGRNYIPPSEEQGVEATEEEGDSSDDDDSEPMCPQGEHTWTNERCLICQFCKFCTGYGPSCCNEGIPGRDPGKDCGCGAGDSGCSTCGCCKVCAGASDNWGGGVTFQELEDIDGEAYERIRRARARASSKREKKDDKGMGLHLLFGGGEHDSEDDSKGQDKKVDELLCTKKPEVVPLPEEQTVMQIDCGAFHTALLLHTGEVYMFGNGNHGQLGQGNNKPCGHPVKVPLPGSAQQVACGDNHTVVLLTSGEVYTFGKHQEGQLGRTPEEIDDNLWHMIPGPVQLAGESYKPKWISACSNQTFISVDESLISETALTQCQAFGHPECIGLLPPAVPDQAKPCLIVINPSTCVAKKLDGEDQQCLVDSSLCIDPEYNVLWSYSPRMLQVSCYNPVAAEVKDSDGTILSPSLCLPQTKESLITRFHAAMNLLSSLHTLSTNPPLSIQALTGKKMRSFSVDDYHILSRFNTHGGGWGYNAGSIEALRISPDQDVLLGGFGLYGGRGQYNAEVKVMELGESSDPETEGTVLVTAEEKGYSCERNKTYRLLFDRPVILLADHWYVIHVMIVSPSGASTDAGSSGLAQVTGPDKVLFKFKNSRKSNNGTDVSSGQIPEILYRIPEFEQESGVSVQLLGKEFSLTVAPDGLQAVQNILEWSWDALAREPNRVDQLRIIVKCSLGVLSSHIKEIYPAKGTNKKAPSDSLELAECVYKTLWLIKRIFSSRQSSLEEFQDVIAACRECFTSCFHAFYPSALLKWFALCKLLQQIDPSDAIAGFPGDNLLSAVLEALSSPAYSYIGLSYDNSYSFQTVLHNSSQEERFPILTEFMQQKTMEEYADEGELLSFTAVSSKLLALVSATLRAQLNQQVLPLSVVVQKAGEFLISRSNELALCASYPEVAALSGLPLTSTKRKEKLLESSSRFSSREVGYPDQSVTDVIFSVNKPILLSGVSVFGGAGDDTYSYEIAVLKEETVLVTQEGSFNRSDYYGENDLVNITFSESLKLEPEVIYTAHVNLEGPPSFTLGTDGGMSVFGPGGVVFSLHSTVARESNPETGPLAKFLYLSHSSAPQNIVSLSVHIASVLLDLTVSFLERMLNEGLTPESVNVLSSSFLLSKLLPTTIAHLGPIASLQPKSSVAVLDIIKRTLPVVSTVTQKLQGDTPLPYMESKLTHYALVETDHPYKPASVSHFKIRFPDKVTWMTLEFDPKCGFAQPDDKLAHLLVPRGRKDSTSEPVSSATVTPMIGVSMDDLYSDFQHFGLDTPAGLVLVPGNEVHIIVNTDTEYEKREKLNHFGIKCKVIGYEWSTDVKECLSLLEKELVSLGAMCAGSLLSEDLNLPFPDELPVSTDPNDTEKADMRIVQAAAQQVLTDHSNLLGRGLFAKVSSVQTVLRGDVPLITNSAEQQFLQDFIKSNVDTLGGRLARWLQPDRSVDPDASDLELKTTDTPMVGKHVQLIVRTRDQDKQVVFVEGMNVEVKAEWKGNMMDSPGSIRSGVDKVTGVRKPTYKRSFNPTMLGTNHTYQSISMMMPYSDYSFEELRFHAPKVIGSIESMAISSNQDGTYTVTWVPTCPGSYDVRVCIDGTVAGDCHSYDVLPPEVSAEDDKEDMETEQLEQEQEQEVVETVVVETIKRKIFTGKKAQGLRIRSQPSFAAAAIGLIKPGDVISYTDEIDNDTGIWIKLTPAALSDLKCSKSEGYALCYSKAKDDEFLDEYESEEIKHVVKQGGASNKRLDGPGLYSVVQCGAAGHNIRSKPNMKGCPLGRLHKGNKIDAIEEIENDDGIWLKLSPESLKKYCQSTADGADGWTLVVHPSGRIFLSQDGDTSYQSKDFPSSAQAFPTAASVFGTPQQSIFGSSEIPVPPPPPPIPPGGSFKFGSDSKGPKLAFGTGVIDKGEPAKKEEENVPLFRFTGSAKDGGKVSDEKEKSEDDEKQDKSKAAPVFNLGVGGSQEGRSKSPRRRRIPVQSTKGGKESEEREKEEKEKGEEKKEPETDESPDSVDDPSSKELSSSPTATAKTAPAKRTALSPAVAECQRAIFAAFLWQEGLVHDAMASSLYLKFHPNTANKEDSVPPSTEETPFDEEAKSDDTSTEGENLKTEAVPLLSPTESKPKEKSEKQKLPSTLHHLVTFWDEISQKVIDNSSASFSPPKVPNYAHELQKRYEEEKKEMEKLKKEKEKKSGVSGPSAAGGGSTMCELCDATFPDPVTYHMKDSHPGCGKHANGWGYNSRGSYCSGWAGNCGDGGRGGSTWYLMCKDCHAKFLSQKEDIKRKVTKTVTVPKMKTRKPGKARSLPVISSVLGMIHNAKFLLEVSSSSDSGKVKSTSVSTFPPDFSRQISTPDEAKSASLPRPLLLAQGRAREAPSLGHQQSQPIPPILARSVSVATDTLGGHVKRTFSDSGEESGIPSLSRQMTAVPKTGSSPETSTLMTKPSMALANLMYLRSCHSQESSYEKLMSFVGSYHDLVGLRVTMKQMMRIASLRATGLEFFEWLLLQVHDPSVIHDILWQFMCSLSDHPMLQAAARTKAQREEEDKEDKDLETKDWSLGKNPLTGLDGAGVALTRLRDVFHSFLQTIANKMSKLPAGSASQQMALRCWCLDFQSQDHSFLLQSKVFANISEALSNMEEVEGDKQPSKQTEPVVQLMCNTLADGKLKVSSNDAMSNSLTDGSTETFWESRDEPRGKPRLITVSFDKKMKTFGACIHIDNTKDSGQRVDQLSLHVGPDEDSLKEVDKCKLPTTHAGWKTLTVPESDQECSIVRFELRGPQNNVRARQVLILGYPDPTARATSSSSTGNGSTNTQLATAIAMRKDCEAEALRLFRLLTSQVFGVLLTSAQGSAEREETDSEKTEPAADEDHTSMANILFNKSRLSGLQKAVCQHIMESVHKEACRVREEWEVSLKDPKTPAPARQVSHDPSLVESGAAGSGPDTYCYELLTMLGGLSQTELGCNYLAEQSQLIKDLVSLLHTASTTRIKLQICTLLRHILPYIKPREFASMTNVTVLPPLGYSAIAEAVNSAATINQLGLLDCLIAVIAKALSVQVKVKGRGSNILQKLTGDNTITAVTLANLKNPKPVAGETHVRTLRWYLQGSIEQEVAVEIVKLLKDMTKSVLKGQWKDYAKSAIGQAVLHLTKVNEEARNADPGMYSHTLWLCLAALCVIDEEHADALSSGQWLGQDGKPQTKPLCDNHDDGETKALILCDTCGNLCGECDRVLHYHKKSKHHQRQVFKEEEEAVKVDLHEGCGRIKLYWTMALADSRTLKGMVEFKDTIGGSGKGACRFCGTTSNTGLLAIGNVCADPECQERAQAVCTKTLSCGHLCCGVKDEKKCLPCLHGCGSQDGSGADPPLKQDADDMCMICYTEGLSCAPSIQLECGHVFHYHCCNNALSKKWSGPRITFRFMFCSICEDKPISHPHLSDVAKPLMDLYSDVTRKCLLRLEYENQSKCEAITTPTSKFYQKPQDYAMWKYAYYVCYKCKKAYYGGEAHCAEAVGGDDYDPTELVCPSCANTGGQLQVCPKHGTDFLEYKCRYCCSVAVYFCFGTTHFCTPCHDDFQRLTSIPKSELPQCPVGPRAKPLSGTECPLHVKHPPTGDEFALGCGVCRNAQTF